MHQTHRWQDGGAHDITLVLDIALADAPAHAENLVRPGHGHFDHRDEFAAIHANNCARMTRSVLLRLAYLA
jgi:hypothetical protein